MREEAMIRSIPTPAIKRLSIMYQYLRRLSEEGIVHVSSRELGWYLDISPHTIRKDISYLKKSHPGGAKYSVSNLIESIGSSLNFTAPRNACVVGLGRIGTAILQYDTFTANGFIMKAGFDSNINRIETVQSSCALFPSYQITEKVKELAIDLAVIAVPSSAAQTTAVRLAEGGIKGIVNYTSTTIRCDHDIHVIDIDVTREFRILSAMIALSDNTNQQFPEKLHGGCIPGQQIEDV